MFWIKAGGVSTLVYFAPSITHHARARWTSGAVGAPTVRIAAYTGGVMVPSARARVRQYIGPLNRLGIDVREYPLPWGNILPQQFALRPFVDSGHGGGTHRCSHLLLEDRRDLDIPPVAPRLRPSPGNGQAPDRSRRG